MLLTIPMWINMLLRTYAWMNLLADNGIINNLLAKIGLGPIGIDIRIFRNGEHDPATMPLIVILSIHP